MLSLSHLSRLLSIAGIIATLGYVKDKDGSSYIKDGEATMDAGSSEGSSYVKDGEAVAYIKDSPSGALA